MIAVYVFDNYDDKRRFLSRQSGSRELMMNSNPIWSFFILTVVVLTSVFVLPTAESPAQSKIDKEEDVKVLFLGEWCDGVVVDKKRNQYLVDFFWSAGSKQEVFDRQNIRRLNEVDAMDYSRNLAQFVGAVPDPGSYETD